VHLVRLQVDLSLEIGVADAGRLYAERRVRDRDLANRVRIGSRSLVGAGALVTEDKQFEDGKMILGAPARAVRDLTPEQIEGIERSAAVYVANAERYATGLKPG